MLTLSPARTVPATDSGATRRADEPAVPESQAPKPRKAHARKKAEAAGQNRLAWQQ